MKVSEEEDRSQKPKEQEKKTQDEVRLSKAEYEDIMSTSKAMLKRIESLEGSKNNSSAREIAQYMLAAQGHGDLDMRPLREEDIDPDDFLPDVYIPKDGEKVPEGALVESVSFFCPKAGYAIIDDIRYNRTVLTPHGNHIWFEFSGEELITTGDGMTYNIIAQYVSRSKKEVEWLRNHRFYNILFFENQDEALNLDVRVFNIFHKTTTYVNSREPGEVHEQLLKAGINPSKNVEANRRRLSMHFAKKEVEEMKRSSKHMNMPIYDGQGRELNEIEASLLNLKAADGE